jgi:hypothetical protein
MLSVQYANGNNYNRHGLFPNCVSISLNYASELNILKLENKSFDNLECKNGVF